MKRATFDVPAGDMVRIRIAAHLQGCGGMEAEARGVVLTAGHDGALVVAATAFAFGQLVAFTAYLFPQHRRVHWCWYWQAWLAWSFRWWRRDQPPARGIVHRLAPRYYARMLARSRARRGRRVH